MGKPLYDKYYLLKIRQYNIGLPQAGNDDGRNDVL